MPSFMRAAFLALFLGCAGLALSSLPALAEPGTAQEQPAKSQAGKFIQTLGDRAIAILAEKNTSPAKRSEKFRQILTDSFDLMTIGRFVIGRSWNAATPAQQQEYMKLFRELVVKTYGDRLSLYTGEGFKVRSSRPESEKDFIVNSEITHPDGSEPTSIDWRVRQKDGKLGVIDVVVEGVSLSVTQRQEYSAVIQSSGGKIDGLLQQMREQVKQPSGPRN